MELRFAHLADYAAADSSGKVTLVGIFDLVWDLTKVRPVPFPPCYLVASFAASLAEGSAHHLEIKLVDADEHSVLPALTTELHFGATGPGNPLRAQVVMGFGPGTLRVPELGDYAFTFLVDGVSQGRVPVSVREPLPGA